MLSFTKIGKTFSNEQGEAFKAILKGLHASKCLANSHEGSGIPSYTESLASTVKKNDNLLLKTCFREEYPSSVLQG